MNPSFPESAPLLPEEGERLKVVQPFPTLVDRPDSIIVPPREWGTLVNTPEPQRILAA